MAIQRITGRIIEDGAVEVADVADNAVTAAKIADANVTSAKIATDAVTTDKIADANVTTDKIADANVTTDKIADANVSAAKLASTLDLSSKTVTLAATFAKTDSAATFTTPQRGTVTTDNDLSFDQNTTNNFSSTPTSGGTLTFTNHTAGQSGYVLLDNSAGVAITAAATTKIHADDLTTISTAGVYLLSYFDNGTNAYVTVSKTFS